MSQHHKRLLSAAGLLEHLIPEDAEDPECFELYELLDPHIATVAEHLVNVAGEQARSAMLLGNLGTFQQCTGRLNEAETTLLRALTIEEEVYGPNHHEVAATLGNLGNVQQELGRLNEAETTQQRALSIKEEVYGPNHHEVAITLGNLGNVQQMLGRLNEAETTGRRALEIFSRALGPDHPNTQQAMAVLDGILADKD